MNKLFSSFIMLLFIISIVEGQNIGINNDGSLPSSGAILDVKSLSKGILIPRTSTSLITTPVKGLMIYDTTVNAFQYYNGTGWVMIGSGTWVFNGTNINNNNSGNVGIGTSAPTSKLDVRGSGTDIGVVISAGNSDASHQLSLFGGRLNDPNPFIRWKTGDPLRFATDGFGFTEYMRINSYGRIGIGTPSPDTSALVDINSTTKGFLPPRMTYAQRNAITTPAAGLMIWCTNCAPSGEIEVFNGYNWTNMSGGTTPSGTVTICNQVWMNQNLNVSTYRNGDLIPEVKDSATWANITTGAYCYYHNDSAAFAARYGKLYNWYAVMDSRGLAPPGWHIPSDDEFHTLFTCLGGPDLAGGAMKEAGTTDWYDPNVGATNSSGWTGLPGSQRNPGGSWVNFPLPGETVPASGLGGGWWTTTQILDDDGNYYAFYIVLGAGGPQIGDYYYPKDAGESVRCIRD